MSASDFSQYGSASRRWPMTRYSAYLLVLVGLGVVTLTGCGPRRLRADFTGYENSYAETSNRELLLNLARLEKHEPPYFFKIGSIQSGYKMAANLNTNASYSLQSSNVALGAATGGGNPSIGYENDPVFTFIPVNDQTNAQFLLQQMPPESFYILYEQGWRVDQLFRLMVDRIELTIPSTKGCEVFTYRNMPPPVYIDTSGKPDVKYSQSQEALSQYTTFLRISAILYALQKHGDLLLSGTNTFSPYDNKSVILDAVASGDSSKPVDDSRSPKATDMIAASNKNAVWEKSADGWLLGEKKFNPVFYLNHYITPDGSVKATPDMNKIAEDLSDDPTIQDLKGKRTLIQQVFTILSNGFSISGTTGQQDAVIGPCSAAASRQGISSHLVMRSLIGLMAAAAQEQDTFSALYNANPPIPAPRGFQLLPVDPKEKDNQPAFFREAVPPVELIPLLSITGESGKPETSSVIQVSYEDKRYRIADLKIPSTPEDQYWNRDVFRLINELTSQVTVDISKFPLPTILQ